MQTFRIDANQSFHSRGIVAVSCLAFGHGGVDRSREGTNEKNVRKAKSRGANAKMLLKLQRLNETFKEFVKNSKIL